MSLFSQLRRLYRPDRFLLEDFHTEIVAQVLRNSPKLTLAWLRGIGVTDIEEPVFIQVATQEQFEKLTGHSTDSRPDIAIRLTKGGKTRLVLIESKVPSKQGPTQLQRYYEQLEAVKEFKGLEETSLVFITRDYEAAPGPLMGSKCFKLARWFEFYRYLKAHVNGDGLAKELKLFMEENHMSIGNQFRSTDLVAMESFSSAKALMDETLQGEVSQAVLKILGSVSPLKKSVHQLRDHSRYIVFAGVGRWDLCAIVGYYLPQENPDKSVWVGVQLQSTPNSKIRNDVVAALRDWAAKSGGAWVADGLDDERAWCGVSKGKALHSLMAGEDHVRAVKDHLLALLEEVRQFKKTYPHLPWATSSPPETDPE